MFCDFSPHMGLGEKKKRKESNQTDIPLSTHWVIWVQISYSKGNNYPEISKTLGNLFFNQAAYTKGKVILMITLELIG